MAGEELRFCYVMCASAEQARTIGRTVVGERLAACANALAPASSVYWWEGKLTEDEEHPLVLKTRAALVPALARRVRELHSYAVPCVVALPIAEGNPDYLAWLAAETGSGG
jgi:periplasmic divalent cation tolerance protein